jgi:hypothetical protein
MTHLLDGQQISNFQKPIVEFVYVGIIEARSSCV